MKMDWDAKLETGVEQIDNQHKEVCRLVNMVLDHEQEVKTEDTLKFLGDYVVRHFADEEALQAASRYPGLGEHKTLHIDFIKVFLYLKAQLEMAKTEEDREISVMSLNSTVVEWLGNHIMVYDRRFADWYKAHPPA